MSEDYRRLHDAYEDACQRHDYARQDIDRAEREQDADNLEAARVDYRKAVSDRCEAFSAMIEEGRKS